MPSSRNRSSELVSDSARDRILRVAARLYTRQGYEATSMRAIADAAGVTKSLVAYHFGSKEELFSSLLREAIGDCRDSADAVLRREASAAERLRAMLRAQFARAREAPEVVAFAHEVMTSPGLLPLGYDSKSGSCVIFDTYVNLIESGQRRGEFRGLDARAVALVALAVVSTYVAAVLSGRLAKIPEGAEDTVFEIVLHGIAREAEQPQQPAARRVANGARRAAAGDRAGLRHDSGASHRRARNGASAARRERR
jgi:TetR/AcrR family transcriptional regulator